MYLWIRTVKRLIHLWFHVQFLLAGVHFQDVGIHLHLDQEAAVFLSFFLRLITISLTQHSSFCHTDAPLPPHCTISPSLFMSFHSSHCSVESFSLYLQLSHCCLFSPLVWLFQSAKYGNPVSQIYKSYKDGLIDKGQFQPRNLIIHIVFARVLTIINMYSLSVAETKNRNAIWALSATFDFLWVRSLEPFNIRGIRPLQLEHVDVKLLTDERTLNSHSS